PALLDYLDAVAARLTPPDLADNRHLRFRLRVVLDPTLNAFTYAHGSIYFHSGLLTQFQNEDQLAAVLAHEMTHAEARHGIRKARSLHNKRVGFTVADALLDIALDAAVRDRWEKARVRE